MAIYSLHHSSIGKSTQGQAYTASAHIAYITRESAASGTASARMPSGSQSAARFLKNTEDKLRKNGRVADKILLALPRELDAQQRSELAAAFAEAITEGRASWFAAFHDKGKDATNPHCHLVICDKDVQTGKRVFGMSEKGSTERLRRLWQEHANAALARAGSSSRIDHRTLQAQGIRRKPSIHIGVRARQLVRDGHRIGSVNRTIPNGIQARSRSRTVAYPAIDAGRLRLEHNIQIRRSNLMQARAEENEKDYWAAIDRDAYLRDIRDLRTLHAVLQFSPDGRNTYRSRDEGRTFGGPSLGD